MTDNEKKAHDIALIYLNQYIDHCDKKAFDEVVIKMDNSDDLLNLVYDRAYQKALNHLNKKCLILFKSFIDTTGLLLKPPVIDLTKSQVAFNSELIV